MNSSTERLTLSIPELAKTLGIAEVTAWKNLRNGRLPIPVIKVGGRTMVRIRDVHSFIETAA